MMIKPNHINKAISLAILVCIAFVLDACRKKEIENPYENQTPVVNNHNPSVDALPVGNFAWLHAKIFRPTCANSGCHDGSFEPEFRYINSAYNSLVNHPVISNDANGTFTYRVVPGSSALSFLHERLTVEIPNTSGMMPLSVDPGSDWIANKTFYIQKIKEWIDGGAKDMYGNNAPAAQSDIPPAIYGMVMFPQGNTTTPYPREAESIYGIGAIEVPASQVDVWILSTDNGNYNPVYQSAAIKASTSSQDFSNALSVNFNYNATPVMAQSFFDETPSPFYYKATLNFAGAAPGTTYYIRCYLDDGAQPSVTEIPNTQSAPFWYLLFSVKIV